VVQTIGYPPGQTVVDDAERKRRGHGVVGEDIAKNSHLRGTLDVAPEQLP
jgi:hypothetical protein